jgi:general stress protein 26
MAEKKHAEELYDLIEDIEIAMLTTRRQDGQLVSRPMATQARAAGADLWFVTSTETEKLDELESDPHVNLAYYDSKSREYVSISGTAFTSRDRNRIRELHRADWRAWFSGEDEKAGTPEDPRMVLIGVNVQSAVYMKVDKPRPLVLFEVVKGVITKTTPDVGEVHHVPGSDLSATG